MAALSCPMCRVKLAPGGTNCPRCGARVAALPRRPRPQRAAAVPGEDGDAGRIAAGVRTWAALNATARGLGLGVALVAACGLLAGASHLLGGSAYAAFGNGTLALGGFCVVSAALAGGIHIQRWGEYAELRRRARDAARIGERRTVLLCAAGVLIAASALTAALH